MYTAVRSILLAAIIAMTVVGCSSDSTPVRFIGEADFSANPALKGSFDDVLVTWLEPADQPQPAGDTGSAGEDRLPIVVTRDETRIFAMEDANGQPNTMQLLDANGAVLAGTGVGQPPAMVKLTAGTYTLVIRRASSIPDSDDMVTVVMPLQSIVASTGKAVQAQASSANGQASPVSYIVNPQITDAVTLANVKVLGDAPAMAMGNLYQATAQALANAAHNATTAQQQAYVTAQAATTMGVATLYSLDTASTGIATGKILGLAKR
ncbi:MAG TPA: RebB family R body protein [Desulfuromonadaceae bacterium]